MIMPRTAFSHVAIGVTDMDRALAFYQDVLGLETAYDAVEDVNQEGVKPQGNRFRSWVDELGFPRGVDV